MDGDTNAGTLEEFTDEELARAICSMEPFVLEPWADGKARLAYVIACREITRRRSTVRWVEGEP